MFGEAPTFWRSADFLEMRQKAENHETYRLETLSLPLSPYRKLAPFRALPLSSAGSVYLSLELILASSLPASSSLSLSYESEGIVKMQVAEPRACTTTWCQEDSKTEARVTIANRKAFATHH
jgi:hypothetical protein